jgi:hypothetical protein
MAEALCWRRAGLPYQEIQGETVVVVPARRELHQLDETASVVWAALARERTLTQLVEAVCEEFDVEAPRAEKDLQGLLELFEEKGLVTRR